MEDKKLDYNKKVKQSKNLARFRYRLSLNEQKLLLCFFSRLKQTDTEFIKDEISVMEAAKFCGFNKSDEKKTAAVRSERAARLLCLFDDTCHTRHLPLSSSSRMNRPPCTVRFWKPR